MTPKRLLLAAAAATLPLATLAPLMTALPARADFVTPTVSQDQANRLSILHDYGLDVIGDATGDGTSVAGHGGGYLGTTPVPGNPGQGAAAAILSKLSDRFTFLQGIQSTDATGTGRSYDLSIGEASGYDSNPKAASLARSGNFLGGDLSAAYHVTGGGTPDPVVGTPFRADFSYTATGVFYSGPRADADAVQQGLGASFRQSFADNALVLTGLANDQFTMEHDAAFLDTFDGYGGAEAFALPQLSVEGSYDYSHFQYFFHPIADAQRPTAERHTLDARLHLYTVSQHRGDADAVATAGLARFVQGALRRATLGYAHVWNFPDQQGGTDYRYQSDRVYIGLEGLALPPEIKLFGQPIGQGTSASVLYSHEFQNYAFDNSDTPAVLSGTGPGHVRRDNLDVFTLRSNTRILDFAHNLGNLTSFLQVDVIHDGSNVPDRHFNELILSSGVTYKY